MGNTDKLLEVFPVEVRENCMLAEVERTDFRKQINNALRFSTQVSTIGQAACSSLSSAIKFILLLQQCFYVTLKKALANVLNVHGKQSGMVE